MKQITINDLLAIINGYLNGEKQEKPAIVWFDCKRDMQLMAMLNSRDIPGLVEYISKLSPEKIGVWEDIGHIFASRATVDLVSDYVKLVVPGSFINDHKLSVKVGIQHSATNPYLPVRGVSAFKYCLTLQQLLGIAIMMFYPISNRNESISTQEYSEFDEYICVNANENVTEDDYKRKWLSTTVRQYVSNGIRINAVDDFYVKFLMQAPARYISYLFDPNGPNGVTGATPERWESVSSKIIGDLKNLFAGGIYAKDEEKEKALKKISTLYNDGNLDFCLLEDALHDIPDDRWRQWFYEPLTFERGIKWHVDTPEINIPRVDAYKIHLCNLFMVNIPSEVREQLLKFHGFM